MPFSSVQPAIDALAHARRDHRTTDAAPFAPAIARPKRLPALGQAARAR